MYFKGTTSIMGKSSRQPPRIWLLCSSDERALVQNVQMKSMTTTKDLVKMLTEHGKSNVFCTGMKYEAMEQGESAPKSP